MKASYSIQFTWHIKVKKKISKDLQLERVDKCSKMNSLRMSLSKGNIDDRMGFWIEYPEVCA